MAPKPPNSDAHEEQYVFDFVGMLGLPLVPTATINPDAEAAFFSVHALKDPAFADKLQRMLRANKPILITDGLAKRLPGLDLENKNLTILKVNGNPRSLLELTREQINPIRNRLLAPFGLTFDAPNKVALYLIGEHGLIVENFNDESIDATLEFSKPVKARKTLTLPGEGLTELSVSGRKLVIKKMTPRTLVAIEYE